MLVDTGDGASRLAVELDLRQLQTSRIHASTQHFFALATVDTVAAAGAAKIQHIPRGGLVFVHHSTFLFFFVAVRIWLHAHDLLHRAHELLFGKGLHPAQQIVRITFLQLHHMQNTVDIPRITIAQRDKGELNPHPALEVIRRAQRQFVDGLAGSVFFVPTTAHFFHLLFVGVRMEDVRVAQHAVAVVFVHVGHTYAAEIFGKHLGVDGGRHIGVLLVAQGGKLQQEVSNLQNNAGHSLVTGMFLIAIFIQRFHVFLDNIISGAIQSMRIVIHAVATGGVAIIGSVGRGGASVAPTAAQTRAGALVGFFVTVVAGGARRQLRQTGPKLNEIGFELGCPPKLEHLDVR
mmetsp:Transcript_45323/g.79185  ORF Transcript_45323/g.79185 Transcript_45323/m.79185 type:complete len:347 (+) Transcript_45323:1557-2597(+)